jgi:TusA-related sulfurtransferase
MIEVLDTRGLKTSKLLLKLSIKAGEMKRGSILEVLGDCPTLEEDLKFWCHATGRSILSSQNGEDDLKIIHIQF